MFSTEYFIIAASILILLSVLASKATGKFGVPALLFFLSIGMLAGSEGIGKISFDSPLLTQGIGILALIFILFSGGLDMQWKEARPILWPGILLSTIGVLITCLLVGVFASYLLHLPLYEGLLLGGIMASTDAAAVFMILRSQKVSLRGHIRPLLELESGSNDPMAVFLTLGFVALLTQSMTSGWQLVPNFFQQMILGALIGVAAGKGIKLIINNIRLEYEALYPALSIGLILVVYGLSHFLGGNGFLAVYLAGVFLKRENFLHKKSLTLFHDGMAWFMQIGMFLVLGLLVFPSKLVPVMAPALAIALFLIFVARPVAVFASLAFSHFSFRDKLMISWVGLRGAVPIILATFPLIAGIPNAELIFNVVFFIVLSSTLIQGTTINLIAKWLKVNAPYRQKVRFPLELVSNKDMMNDLFEIDVPKGAPSVGKSIVDLVLPKGSLIVLIRRKGDVFVPRGSTQIEENDALLILADKNSLDDIFKLVDTEPSEGETLENRAA